jgi:uncharacterized membrane protein YdjX (TVP38/TMEM64 family)
VSRRREYFSLAVVAAVLLSTLWFARSHADALKQFIDHHPILGIAVYIFLNILDSVIAPGATLPLIPIAVRAWGHIPAALITMAGWTAGSLIAFSIARRWGVPIVKRLTSLDEVKPLRQYIPHDPFWTVVVLRLFAPMDVISYAVGLFTDMSWGRYALATALGLAPSAFILAYVGRTPRAYDLIMLGVGGVVIGWIIYSTTRNARTLAPARHRRSA